MKQETIGTMQSRWSAVMLPKAGVVLLAVVVVLAAGCKMKQSAAPTDQQIATDIQTKIKGESALAQQNIQVSVVNGVATLNGTVSDDASRALAANDSGTISGVKTVINNLTVQSAAVTPAPAPEHDRPGGRANAGSRTSALTRPGFTRRSQEAARLPARRKCSRQRAGDSRISVGPGSG